MSVMSDFPEDSPLNDELFDEGDNAEWEVDVESARLLAEAAGPVWEDIEHRWGAQVLNPLPRSGAHWAELWQALPEAGGMTTVVIATSMETLDGPEPVLVEQREFDDLEMAKVWAQEWVPAAG